MLRVFTDVVDETSRAVIADYCNTTGGNGGSVAYPVFWPNHAIQDVSSERSSLDFIRTTRAKRLGQHGCSNFQARAAVYYRPSFEEICCACDPLHELQTAGTNIVKPASILGYSQEQLSKLLVFGADAAYQECSPSLGLLSNPSHLFLPGGGAWIRTSSENRNKSALRSVVTASGYFLTWNGDHDRGILTRVYVGRADVYTLGGVYRYTDTYAGCTVVTRAPATNGNLRYSYDWFLNASNSWIRSYVQSYPLPHGLTATPPLSVVDDYLLHPEKLIYAVFSATMPPRYSLSQPMLTLGDEVDTSLQKKAFDSLYGRILLAKAKIEKLSSVIDFAELGDKAADGIQDVSINSLAYLLQVDQVFGTVKETFSLLGAPTDPTKWAKWWLSLRYGDRLTFRDTNKLIKEAGNELRKLTHGWRNDFYKSHSREVTSAPLASVGLDGTVTGCLTLFYKPKFSGIFPSLYSALDKWDLWPTLSDAWDLVPFSFVVDWFVDVQGCLERIDRDNRLIMNDVLSVATSLRWDVNLDDVLDDGFYITDLGFVLYSRDISRSLPTTPFRVDRGHLSAINIIDGITLLYAG